MSFVNKSGINFSVNEDDCSDGEAMLRDLVRDTGGELKIVRSESEFRAVAVRSVNPVTIYRGDLEFTPHLRVKVIVLFPSTMLLHVFLVWFAGELVSAWINDIDGLFGARCGHIRPQKFRVYPVLKSGQTVLRARFACFQQHESHLARCGF